MLIINRYTCPNTLKRTICVHEVKSYKVFKSYAPMNESNIELFKGKNAMIFDVSHSNMLEKINLIKL